MLFEDDEDPEEARDRVARQKRMKKGWRKLQDALRDLRRLDGPVQFDMYTWAPVRSAAKTHALRERAMTRAVIGAHMVGPQAEKYLEGLLEPAGPNPRVPYDPSDLGEAPF